jgi:membrane-bound serine protease (ClpP class)
MPQPTQKSREVAGFCADSVISMLKRSIMRTKWIKLVFPLLLICAACLFKAPMCQAQQESLVATSSSKATVVTCQGMIDDGLFKSIKRRVELAIEQGATHIILEISTYGGLVQSADDISKFLIFEASKKAHTVAYVKTEAISAGAMISVSCQDIVMRENATIGDCAPISMGQKLEGVEREKAESFIRAIFDRAAQANGYPQALLRAMVSQHIEVYRVKHGETDEYAFFETVDLPTDANAYDLESKKIVVEKDKILTMEAALAHEYGVARAVVEDVPGLLTYLEKRDDVVFPEPPIILETNWSEEMVRKLNHPAVMSVLVMIAMLGLYIEFGSPGLGLPGLAAVVCFTVIIGSKYLTGLANWVEVALFMIGILLLLIEFLVIPGFGIAGIAGIVCVLAGVFGMLIRNPPDQIPWPQTSMDWQDLGAGLLGLSLGFGGFLVLAGLCAKYMTKLRFLSGLILTPSAQAASGILPVSRTSTRDSMGEPLRVGMQGRATTPLRPAGTVRFQQNMVDCVAQGSFIAKGTLVEIFEIHGNRVTVRSMEQ